MSGRKKQAPIMMWRVRAVVLALAVLPCLLVWRLIDLQVLDTDKGVEFLKRQGAMRSVRSAEIPAYRGKITDRRGTPLAVSTPVVSLWANPQHLRDSNQIDELALALGVPRDELASRIELYSGKQFMYLSRHRTPPEARSVLALGVNGVQGEREYRRFYPAGEVASQLVGLTSLDGEGVSGLELAFDDWLTGSSGRKRYIKDLHGDAVRDIGVIKAAEPGRDLALSIDLRLQYLQHRELQQTIAETGAVAAAAVTIDAWTGEILAISNHPVFNPNSRGFDYAATRNRVLTDVFEPGSIMKPLTLVAALESGDYDIDTIVDTSPGRIKVGSKVLIDPRNYGELTTAQVIEKSSQVGVTKIAQQVGHEAIRDVYARFGLGAPTSIGFPGERSGLLPEHARWSEIDKVTLAFGYGLSATPLQLAQAYAIFANEGSHMPLTFLRREQGDQAGAQQVIEPEIATKVLSVLHGVTGPNGTGKQARVAGFEVGGKTGTVHKVGEGGYRDDEYVALFVGIAPVEQPRYVTAVVIDRPRGDSYGGGAAAAPLYGRITKGVLRMRNAVPDLGADDAMQVARLAVGMAR